MADVPGVAALAALAAQIDEVGAMEMHPEAARACARACDDYQAVLESLRESIRYHRIERGFGHLDSGQILNAKFNAKLNGAGPNSLTSVLQRHLDVVGDLRDAFARVADTVEATEAGNAQRFPDGPR